MILAPQVQSYLLQHRGMLDFFLKQLLTGKLKDLHPVVRDILHLGLYQIYELDKIPESAAVNESVDLAKKYCRTQRAAPGLVNAVLRNAVRTKGTLKQPTTLEDRYSHPWELIKLLRDYVGKERIEMMLRANNEAPNTVIQVNTLKISASEERHSVDGLDVGLVGLLVYIRLDSLVLDCVLRGVGEFGVYGDIRSASSDIAFLEETSPRISFDVGIGGDDTLYALTDGILRFERFGKFRKRASVHPVEAEQEA